MEPPHNPDRLTEHDVMYNSCQHCHEYVMYMELTVCSLLHGLFPSGPDGPLDK